MFSKFWLHLKAHRGRDQRDGLADEVFTIKPDDMRVQSQEPTQWEEREPTPSGCLLILICVLWNAYT